MKKKSTVLMMGVICMSACIVNAIDYTQELTYDSQTVALWNMNTITRNAASSRINDVSGNADKWLMIRDTTGSESPTLGTLVSGPTAALSNALYFNNGAVGASGDTMFGGTRRAIWLGYETVKIESWIKVDALGDLQWIVENDQAWRVWILGDIIRFTSNLSDGSSRNLDLNISGHANEWLHFVASFDSMGQSFFEVTNLSGSFSTSTSANDAGKVLASYNEIIWVGSDSGTRRYFTGAIDDLRISIIPIPEPATIILLGSSFLFLRRKQTNLK